VQNVLSKQQIEAEDRKVGYVCAVIGTVVVGFMATVVAGLNVYHQAFYTWLH
jgi:hypothetical protein